MTEYDNDWYLQALGNKELIRQRTLQQKEHVDHLARKLRQAKDILNDYLDENAAVVNVTEAFQGIVIGVFPFLGSTSITCPTTPRKATVKRITDDYTSPYMFIGSDMRFGTTFFGRDTGGWSEDMALHFAKQWVTLGIEPS